MTILSSDIILRQAERMTDFDDGGGQMSAVEIVDNVLDNVFSDRSELDSIFGRLSLRKVYVQVNTANTDTYLGAFAFLTDPPLDPKVSVTMIDTLSWTDERTDAQTYVENYRIQGVKTQFTLYGDHIIGQQTIQVFCTGSEISSPEIGDVLMLSIEAIGFTAAQQKVKVDSVASRQTLSFEDGSGIYYKDVLIINLTSPLIHAFPGQDPPERLITQNQSPTVIRFTNVSSSSTYYGIRPAAASVSLGDLSVKVDTPYVSVVPSSNTEQPLVDILAGNGDINYTQSGADGVLTASFASGAVASGVSRSGYFGNTYLPGSLEITVGSTSLEDDGNGNISAVDPSVTSWSGVADYEGGSFTLINTNAWNANINATANPAGGISAQGYSMFLGISDANRTNVSHVFQLPILPAPGTVLVDYLFQGNWIRLRDNGNGSIAGNVGEGAGTINYETGAGTISTGGFPDNGSDIIISFGVEILARDVHGDVTIPDTEYTQQLSHGGNSGTATITWHSATVAKTGTADTEGNITGDATGHWNRATGLVKFTTGFFPDAGFTYNYSYADPSKVHGETFHLTTVGGEVSFTLAHPAEAGTVHLQFQLNPVATLSTAVGILAVGETAVDDGSGGWTFGLFTHSGTNTIDYSTGDVTIHTDSDFTVFEPTYNYSTGDQGTFSGFPTGFTDATGGYLLAAGQAVIANYLEDGASVTTFSETFAAPPIQVFLGIGSTGPAVPGSIRLSYRGRIYSDLSGSLYYGISPSNGAGTFGGTYDYSTNTATFTDYAAGSSNTVTVVSMLTKYWDTGITSIFFRTPGSPLEIGNFTWRATLMDGTLRSGAADNDGNLTGTGVRGIVNWDTGMVQMMFGAYVTAAGNESQPWYDPDQVVGSTVWKPDYVNVESIFIGCVVLKSVPQDPSVLKIDPTPLPSTGKVLGFRRGGIAIVHNTQTHSETPTASEVTDLGRTGLAFVEIVDSASPPVPIDPSWYTTDLDAGTVTWSASLNLSAYTMPVNMRHRIEWASVVTDIQPTGELAMQSPSPHAFAESGTYVSACLIIDDLQARYTDMFDQQTWTNVFSDTLIGSGATASYNDVDFPVTVVNKSLTQDRWAFIFKSTSVVTVVGEVAGDVGDFPIASDIAPVNPVSGIPYFTVHHEGWGSGWAAGNVLRFNTIAANHPMWLLRCTTQGAISVTTDHVRLQIYGDAA